LADYDLCVIGSGPGGQKAAIQAAKLGKNVCIVERMERVGGVAIHTGTIPSKALREAIIRATTGKDHLDVRGDVKAGRLTISHLLESCQRIIATEMEIVRVQLRRNGISLLSGTASFVGPNEIEVAGQAESFRVSSDKFVIATGTVPSRPDSIPFDCQCILTSDDLLHLEKLPQTLVVVGAGVIGTEFASMFARLGVRVTLVERSGRVLGFLDSQIGEALQYHLRSRGITMRLNEEVVDVVRHPEGTKGRVESRLKSGKVLHSEIGRAHV